MKLLLVFALGLAVVTGAPSKSQRIVGGSITNISEYPFGAALLFSWTGIFFSQSCGGSILNNRSILSAAHCFTPNQSSNWRIRLGSTNANSGGVVYNTQLIINHPLYNQMTLDNDISILRVSTAISFNINVQAGSIAGPNFNVPDNSPVWAIGWGRTSFGGSLSEQLRHVQVWVINQAICGSRYAEIGRTITDNMLCSGWLDVGGRDQCQGDSGGPLLFNNVIVGVCSWGEECALPRFPGVNVRVSRFTAWIQNNDRPWVYKQIVHHLLKINNYEDTVITSPQCSCSLSPTQAARWRMRVGSTTAHSGGVIHNTNWIINHPSFNSNTLDSDIAVLRAVNNFVFRASVRAGRFPNSNFNVPDIAAVWAIGWGRTAPNGSFSERLRRVQIWVVNQTVCRNRYAEIRRTVTANMLCAGWLDVGGRDQCQGDSGGLLLHNGIVVGVSSWGESCGLPRFPGVNARVTRFISWITSNA